MFSSVRSSTAVTQCTSVVCVVVAQSSARADSIAQKPIRSLLSRYRRKFLLMRKAILPLYGGSSIVTQCMSIYCTVVTQSSARVKIVVLKPIRNLLSGYHWNIIWILDKVLSLYHCHTLHWVVVAKQYAIADSVSLNSIRNRLSVYHRMSLPLYADILPTYGCCIVEQYTSALCVVVSQPSARADSVAP